MPKSTKGKTWEEIYGKEYAEIKRKQIMESFKNRKTNKGKKWEEIYSPEEVIKRKERMKNNNPIKNMSEETAKNRKLKLSDIKKEYYKTNKNPMQDKKHTEDSKLSMSKTKKEKYKDENNLIKIRKAIKEKTEKYFENNAVIFKCKLCKKEMFVLPMFLGKNKDRKFCSTECQYEYYRQHPHIKYKINSWEQRVIDLNIDNVKFTGDFKFWITINFKNKLYHKNPDFIITKYSDKHAVIEILGGRFHNAEENMQLAQAYKEKSINYLFLTDLDFNLSDIDLKNKIQEWIKNVK